MEKEEEKEQKRRHNVLENIVMDLHLPEVTSMDNDPLEKDSNTWPKGDDSLKMGLEMTQCNAGSSSCLKKKKRKKKKRKNNTLKGKDINDNHPKDTSINVSPVKIDSLLHPLVNTCLSTDVEIRQHDAEVILSQNMENGKKQNKRHNALTSNGSNQEFQESGCQSGHYLTNTEFIGRVDGNSVSEVVEQLNSFQKCLDPRSAKKHEHTRVRTYQRKKQVTQVVFYQRKKRKLSDYTVSSLESIEGASPSVHPVRDSSGRDTSLNHVDEAPASGYSEKMMGEVVAGNGTSLLVEGDISLEKASGECPVGEPASGEQENKTKMEKVEENINEHNVVKDASQIDLLGKIFEQGNRDKLDLIQNAVLDVYSAEEISLKSTTFYTENRASDDVSGIDPSVENLEFDNLDVQPKLKDTIPSQVGVIADDASLAVIRKEGPRQRLQLSLAGAPPDNSRKKLLVLDVNGLLADIVSCASEGYMPDTVISRKAVFKRPFCDDFLQFCFERFHVGVWSSRTKRNVESVLDFLMGKSKCNLLFCWNQSHCTVTGFNTVENRDKPLLLKELKKLWEKHEPDLPWERGEYNESNTLLLDDSPYKSLRNPPHTAIFPHTYQYNDVKDNSLGPDGDLRVYLEGLALADNVQKYVELNPFGQRPITKTNLSWAFYLKVIGTTSSLQEEDANACSACQ